MKKYQAYLIDLDGTMYSGSEKIDAALDFVNRLKQAGLQYLFVTNNSTRKKEQVAEKLRSFGVPAEPEQIITSSSATADYIHEKNPRAKVYFIGEEGLEYELTQRGFEITPDHPDFVIAGLDRFVTYEKFAAAVEGVNQGAAFVSTNPDRALPSDGKFLPGNGALTSVISVATATEPVFIGKPEPVIVDQALQLLGLPKEQVVMVGDNYDTDIKAGMNAGIDTLLVHTGVTGKEDLKERKTQPTHVVDSLDEWHF